MAERVEVNYDDLERIRSTFSQQSQEIQNMLRRMSNQVDGLRGGGWIGRGADAFYAEMDNEILPAIQRLIRALDEADRVVAQIMAEFRRAEEESRSVWEPY